MKAFLTFILFVTIISCTSDEDEDIDGEGINVKEVIAKYMEEAE